MKCTICYQEIDGDIRREDFQILEEEYPGQSNKDTLKDTHICRDCANKRRTSRAGSSAAAWAPIPSR